MFNLVVDYVYFITVKAGLQVTIWQPTILEIIGHAKYLQEMVVGTNSLCVN